MIPLDKLRSIKHLVAHASCPDGVASALIVKDALPDVRVSFVKYGTEEHKSIEPAPGTIFCDFSPWLPKLIDPRVSVVDEEKGDKYTITDKGVSALRDDLIARWREAGVIVLDHHSRDVVEPYGEFGVFGENERLECGAWLAYEHVWLPLKRPGMSASSDRESANYEPVQRFAELAAVRDTWKKDDPRWREACEQAAALVFFPFEDIPSLRHAMVDGEVIGQLLLKKQLTAARTAISESHRFQTTKGTRVLVFQGVSATSDAAEILDKEWFDARGEQVPPATDLVVGFHYKVDGGKLQLQFSTRSHTGFDCQALARAHGGNGHRAAAGFTVEGAGRLSNPYEVFSELLNDWEEAR